MFALEDQKSITTRSVGQRLTPFSRYLGAIALSTMLLATGPGCTDTTEGNPGEGTGFIIGDSIVMNIDPASITFGSVVVGDSASQIVTVTHLGDSGTLRLSNMVLESGSTEFTLTEPVKMSMLPGESVTFTVAYAPLDEVTDAGLVVFDTNVTLPGGGTLRGEVPIKTLKPYGQLRAQPSVLDFGAVSGGTSVTKTILFQSIGTLPVTVTDIALKSTGVSDFSVAAVPAVPSGYAPEGTFPVDITYTPTLGDVDTIQLRVRYTADAEELELMVLIKGTEITPRMVVFPNPVNFGKVDPGVEHTLPLSISNQGTQPLDISAISIESQGDWSYTVTLDGAPTGATTLAAGGAPLTLTVKFNPPADMPVVTSPIASVRIDSNDPLNGGVTQIPVFGSPQAPSLQVNPGDVVDFGFVAQGQTITRKVTLFNAGTADLTVSEVWQEDAADAIAGEYQLKNAAAWGPTATPAVAAVMGGGDNAQVSLTFTNTGGNTGVAWGKLTITSNDPQNPTWEVNLKAQRAGSPECKVELVPDQVDYGIVPRGFSKTLSFQLTNVGSGACGYLNSFVNDCAGWGGFFGTSCDDPNLTIQTDGTSDYYTISEEPFSAAGNLKPGESYPIKVTFTPPESAPLFGDELQDYAGLLAVRVTHSYTTDGSTETIIWPNATGGSYPPNLHGKSGIAQLSVFPGELGFGLTTIGCHSQTLTVNAYNVGSAPLDISHFELQGCSPEFTLKSYPALTEPDEDGGFKKTLQPDDGVQFDLDYAPQDEGQDTDGDGVPDAGDECALAIYTNGSDTPAAVVPLAGIGTFETEHTDEYIQKTGQDVDVLFVVDNSGSMGEEQGNLSGNFTDFINEALTWSNDYHLAVVTTDIDGDGGVFQGTPRVVTSADISSFANNIKVGTNGAGTEQGMFAAQLALSLPLISDTGTACTAPADCNAPDTCVEGFCGGPNRGFLRKEAALEIVFLSDEEDQSPSDLAFYENFFKNIKGFYNASLLHVHAIVGPPGGCSSSNGDASSGNRYWDLAAATGGNQISICEPDFATGLKSIGEIAFGLKLQFFLARVPVPTTIEVKVNDVACPSAGGANWSYDAPSNAVVFNETGACLPQPGDGVWIHYDTICFLE